MMCRVGLSQFPVFEGGNVRQPDSEREIKSLCLVKLEMLIILWSHAIQLSAD